MTAPPRLVDGLADRYRIERELGAGGMATVYLAEDVKHHRKVAIKVLRPELSAVLGSERFLKEIELTASLQHPNILPLFDSGSAEGLLYYVMPFVEGETLRARLEREHQLPIPEAVRIASAVAAALDYAHRHGAVHRDIKPENILLADGNVLVADFGIALALRDAGGARLTETGLSLGTPQYMSPEQATAERTVDGRTDIYSLGATLYEMLAGEPPFTAPTSQGVIAKLLTQSPVHLRLLRDTVPPGLDGTVDRMLAKLPADRFATCREVIDALAAAPSSTASTAPITAHAARSRALRGGGIVGLAALVLVAAWFGRKAGADARSRSGGVGDAGITLQDRIQLTTTGQARLPAISADGKQLAYVTTQCDDAGCSDGLDVQDVGGIMTHRIFEVTGAALIWLLWSPDRRHLIARGTIGGRSGCWLLSALGGPPHYLNRRASFFAGGDSLLTADSFSADSIFWLRVAGLDGTPHDSIRVAAPARRLRFLFEVPGTPWIVVALQLSGSGVLIRIIDRQGAISSQIEHTGVVSMRVSRAAIWLQVADRLVRTSLDPASGGLASRSDTLLLGTPAGDLRGVGGTFDITADGGRLVVDNGIYAYDLRAIEWRDLARSPLPGNSILQSSSETFAALAPNGTRLAILQHQDRSAARARVSILPFGGGSPTTLLEGVVEGGWRGIALGAIWSDTTTLALVTRKAGRARFERINVPGGVPEVALTIADSAPESFDWIPSGGWTWIPEGMRRIMWQGSSDSAPRTLAMPATFTYVHVVRASPDGRRLAFWVEGKAGDSLRVVVASLASGELTTWHIFAGEGAQLQWLNDNTIILDVHRAHAEDIYHLTGPGKSRPVGEVRRTVIAFSVSRDMKRAIVGTREYRGDIWMSRVVEH